MSFHEEAVRLTKITAPQSGDTDKAKAELVKFSVDSIEMYDEPTIKIFLNLAMRYLPFDPQWFGPMVSALSSEVKDRASGVSFLGALIISLSAILVVLLQLMFGHH